MSAFIEAKRRELDELDQASLDSLFSEIRRRYKNGIDLAKLQNVDVLSKRKASLEILDASYQLYMSSMKVRA